MSIDSFGSDSLNSVLDISVTDASYVHVTNGKPSLMSIAHEYQPEEKIEMDDIEVGVTMEQVSITDNSEKLLNIFHTSVSKPI
mmetsp:Transcript_14114/g.17724  ORF Transcript_14114/g.17724 Transcript_14114/m.17724 type:complete len:83 (+) Transcript_14114:2-250(+)